MYEFDRFCMKCGTKTMYQVRTERKDGLLYRVLRCVFCKREIYFWDGESEEVE